jgi:hypothetical protein
MNKAQAFISFFMAGFSLWAGLESESVISQWTWLIGAPIWMAGGVICVMIETDR